MPIKISQKTIKVETSSPSIRQTQEKLKFSIVLKLKFTRSPGEYILQSTDNSNSNELDNLLLEEALQLVGIDDLNVSIEREPGIWIGLLMELNFNATYFHQDNKNDQNDKLDEAAKPTKEESSSAEASEDLEAILENNLKQDDFDFDLSSPLSILLNDTDEIDLLNEMMIQPSSTHFQHPRQPSQNYAHCVNSYRQNGYQVSRIVKQ